MPQDPPIERREGSAASREPGDASEPQSGVAGGKPDGGPVKGNGADPGEAWRPEDPGTWGATLEEPRPEWRPEHPETWEQARTLTEKKSRGRRSRRRSSRRGSGGRGPTDGRRRSSDRSKRRSRRSRYRRPRPILKLSLLLLGLLVVGFIAVVADAYWQSAQIYREVRDVQPQLARARSYLGKGLIPPGDPFQAASGAASKAQDSVDSANFTFRLTGHLPFLNRPVEAVRLGVDAANQEAQAAIVLRNMVQAVLGQAALQGKSGQEAPVFHDGRVDVGLLQSLTPSLESAIRYLQAGDRDLRAIPAIPFSHRVQELKSSALAESGQAITLAQNALAGVRLLPSFMGVDRPKTYYLALQNNSDQRATGGAVLGYGLLTVDNGAFSLVSGGSINDVDTPVGFPEVKLPPNLQWYLDHVPKQHPRLANVNMTPDFPLAAQGWRALGQFVFGRRIDGAIAIDPIAIARILGSRRLNVDSYPGPITGADAVRVIENGQYLLPKDLQRDFPNQIIRAAWPIISNPHPFLPTTRNYQAMFNSKNIQIWSADPREEALLHRLHWDGALNVNPGDYLYATDSKLTGNKADYYTRTKIVDHVRVAANGSITSNVQVTLINDMPPGLPGTIAGTNEYGVNDALLGLYAPRRARQVRPPPTTGVPPHTEGPAKVMLQYFVKSLPGHPGSAQWTYTVPGVIQTTDAGKLYQLTVQHQPLLHAAELSVTVSFPAGTVVKSWSPGWTITGSSASMHMSLTRDFVTHLVF